MNKLWLFLYTEVSLPSQMNCAVVPLWCESKTAQAMNEKKLEVEQSLVKEIGHMETEHEKVN